ncbi:uncharacterized protein DEA37_0002909 [Paragonimus westermani]|uniref:Uncharacterized protein n=1 Tax=Paragonimus westermani TaxID=34504 RepID=A0A5J4NY26_9TREM|nr:uncharacterized protein DEA37_0002909 [Paragonimus westermani]
MKLEEFVELYASLVNSPYFKSKNTEDVDQLVLSCRLPLEKQLMELKQLVSTSAATLDQLCFERQQLRVECDQLEQTIRIMESERTQRLTERENAIKQQNDRFSVLRTKCSMYEEITDTRFMTNDGSTVAFISNPDGVIQHRMAVTDHFIDESNKYSARELDEINALWARLKVPDRSIEFMADPSTWSMTSKDTSDLTKTSRRTVLKSLTNVP